MRSVSFSLSPPTVRQKSRRTFPPISSVKQFVQELSPGDLEKRRGASTSESSSPYLIHETIHPADRAFAQAAQQAIIQKFESASRKRERIQASFQFRVVTPDGKVRLLNHVLSNENSSNSDGHQISITETDLSNFATHPVKTVRVFEKEDMDNATILQLEGFEEKDNDTCPFSDRQLEILKLLSEGRKTAEISDSLFISVDTVRTHRQHILQRSTFSNMTATVVDCVRKGWI